MDKKMLQVNLNKSKWDWIKQTQKEMKIKKITEFVNILIEYHMQTESKEFKTKLMKARLHAELKTVVDLVQEGLKQKEKLEDQLEAVSA